MVVVFKNIFWRTTGPWENVFFKEASFVFKQTTASTQILGPYKLGVQSSMYNILMVKIWNMMTLRSLQGWLQEAICSLDF